jgi:hypothetical protein
VKTVEQPTGGWRTKKPAVVGQAAGSLFCRALTDHLWSREANHRRMTARTAPRRQYRRSPRQRRTADAGRGEPGAVARRAAGQIYLGPARFAAASAGGFRLPAVEHDAPFVCYGHIPSPKSAEQIASAFRVFREEYGVKPTAHGFHLKADPRPSGPVGYKPATYALTEPSRWPLRDLALWRATRPTADAPIRHIGAFARGCNRSSLGIAGQVLTFRTARKSGVLRGDRSAYRSTRPIRRLRPFF